MAFIKNRRPTAADSYFRRFPMPSFNCRLLYFLSQRVHRQDVARELTHRSCLENTVEIVLLWLYIGGQVPRIMTFEGYNFDIVSGILAPIVYLIAFRGGKVNRPALIAYNILGLLLLANIVSIAVLSLPSPLQLLAFDQPNVAVTYFPFIWLPTIVVPIVLFAHLASLWKLSGGRDN